MAATIFLSLRVLLRLICVIVMRVNVMWYIKRPALAIRNVNTNIADDSQAGMFVTFFYGIPEVARHTLKYMNAGHNPPIICHPEDGHLTELKTTGITIGALSDAGYTTRTNVLNVRNITLLNTNGIAEPRTVRADVYGEERLYAVICQSQKFPAQEIINVISESVRTFCGSYLQSDDLTQKVILVK